MSKPGVPHQRKLAETTNFIQRYMHYCGDTEVPESFNLWTCISLISSCVGKNVWIQKFQGRPDEVLYPNLYVFMIGPSSLGKDTAANVALGLLKWGDFAF